MMLNTPEAARHTANIDPDQVSDHARKPYALVSGTQIVSATWVGDIRNQFTKPVYRTQGGKKGK